MASGPARPRFHMWISPETALHLYVHSCSAVLWLMRSSQACSIGTVATRPHCQKHGVSIAEIEALFRGTPQVAPDLKHAHLEDRLIAVGRTAQGRPLFVAFTIRERFGQPTIRPVSARYMHEREARNYEAQGSQNDD
jgi:uncharacterized DUF497 family protein